MRALVIVYLFAFLLVGCVSQENAENKYRLLKHATTQEHIYKFVSVLNKEPISGTIVKARLSQADPNFSENYKQCTTLNDGTCAVSFMADKEATFANDYGYKTSIVYEATNGETIVKGETSNFSYIHNKQEQYTVYVRFFEKLNIIQDFHLPDEILRPAMDEKLKDTESARFKDIKAGIDSKGIITFCGKVNSKNSYGAYSGYHYFIGMTTRDKKDISIAGIGEFVDQLCASHGLE